MKKVKYIQSGYTLIELIVVIALVMILGRIAFASYSSYMSDTRNTKRTVDLNRLQSVIETREIGSDLSIISFVDDSTPVNVITGAVNEVSGGKLWIAGNLVGTGSSYRAGKVNFSILNISEASTRDPLNSPYSFGATVLKDGQFQLAATLEGGLPKALVVGNYVSRTISGVLAKVSTRDNTKIKILDPKDYSRFLVDDIIQLNGGTGRILSFSDDTSYIIINTGTTMSGTISLYNTYETSGLIGSYNTANPTRKGESTMNESTVRLPY